MTRRLKILGIHVALVFGIALACDIWNLADRSAQLMGMLP
jgi:hypothetical protein